MNSISRTILQKAIEDGIACADGLLTSDEETGLRLVGQEATSIAVGSFESQGASCPIEQINHRLKDEYARLSEVHWAFIAGFDRSIRTQTPAEFRHERAFAVID